jgi:hypothetical protein
LANPDPLRACPWPRNVPTLFLKYKDSRYLTNDRERKEVYRSVTQLPHHLHPQNLGFIVILSYLSSSGVM